MPQHESRPFGPYTEILLVLRMKFERVNRCDIIVDASQKIGVPIWSTDGLSYGLTRLFYCHPLDYIWALTGHDLELYSKISRQWQLWRIEQMAEAANARLSYRLGYLNGREGSVAIMEDIMHLFKEEFWRAPVFTGKRKIEIARG